MYETGTGLTGNFVLRRRRRRLGRGELRMRKDSRMAVGLGKGLEEKKGRGRGYGYDMGYKEEIKLKLRSGSGTTAHGRNVTRFISHCDGVDEGSKGAARWCPMRYKDNWTLGGESGLWLGQGQGVKALASVGLDSVLQKRALKP